MKHDRHGPRSIAGTPSQLATLAGLPIKEAYVGPDLITLILVLGTAPGQPNKCLMANAITVAGALAIRMEIGDMKSDAPMDTDDDVDLLRVRALEGLHLGGLDGNVLTVGKDQGIRFSPGCPIQFVRRYQGTDN